MVKIVQKRSRSNLAGGTYSSSLLQNLTRYGSLEQQVTPATAEVAVQTMFAGEFVLRNLYVKCANAAGANESYVFTVMVSGVASSITVTIAGATAKTGSDTTNTASVSAEDYITLRIVGSANANETNNYGSWCLEVDSYE